MSFHAVYRQTLVVVTLALLVMLAAVVLYAVAARTAGSSPIWYDEVASVMLAWLSFLGAALAALQNAHLNFETLLVSRRPGLRRILFVIGELVYYAVFGLLVWAGWSILEVFGDESLTSLRFVPLSLVHSVVPVGAGLMILSRLLNARTNWERVMAGRDTDTEEIEAEIARAQAELNKLAP
ncbi:MAG: TRAP transporter small permease [Burkholderiaceae bacterium]